MAQQRLPVMAGVMSVCLTAATEIHYLLRSLSFVINVGPKRSSYNLCTTAHINW